MSDQHTMNDGEIASVTAAKEDFPPVRMNEAREAAQLVQIGSRGVTPENVAQLLDWAKTMSLAREAVPKHLRGNPGACAIIWQRSREWGLSFDSVANQTYIVNDRMAYMSQLFIAVINKYGSLKGILRPAYENEGTERVCIVRAEVKNEVEPLEYRSPPIGQINPKNSPLWKNDPDQQLWYYSARAFVRRFFPHIMMGIYGVDELQDNPQLGSEHVGPDAAKDVTPQARLAQRLAAAAHGDTASREGFRHGVVEDGINGNGNGKERVDPETGEVLPAAEEADAEPAAVEAGGNAPKEKKRTDGPRKGGERPSKAKAAKPAAKPDRAEPEKPAARLEQPRNTAEYAEYVAAWLPTETSAQEVEARWRREMRLRNACGVSSEDRAPMRKKVEARVAEIESAQIGG